MQSFSQLKKDTDQLAGQMKFHEALKVLEAGLEQLPEEEQQKYQADLMIKKVHYYRMCEMEDQFIEELSAMFERKLPVWRWLVDELPLDEKPIYRELKEKNDQLLDEAQKTAKVEYIVHLPEGYTPDQKYPLFLALHGGGGNMEEFSMDWPPDVFVAKGFIFVYVQSSQVSWGNGYNWNHCPTVQKDIQECYEQLTQKYSIDTETVLIGGFCGGAIGTVEVAMSNAIPLKGFIAISPDEKPDSFTKENVEAAMQRRLKGVFTEGELFLPVPDEDEMMEIFDQTGFQYQYYINQGVGLSIPEDLPAKLEMALKFILD